jgi:hypothetical protein
MVPEASLISTPPGLVTMRPPLAAASMVKNCGVFAARLAKVREPKAHAERAPGFSKSNVEPQDTGFVLALERDEVAANIEHGDGERCEIAIAAFFQGDVDDGGGLRESDLHVRSSVKVRNFYCLSRLGQ